MTTIEERVSRLEGVIEGAIPQINQRLGNLEQGQADLRREMSSQFTEIHRELRSQFRWLIGTLLGTGVALLASIITGFISLSNS